VHGGLAFGFWPALRGLSRISFGFEPLTGPRIEAAAVRERATRTQLTSQTRLARLPLLESISSVERTCFPPGLIASLAMRTLLVNPISRRPGLGLRDIIVSADSLGSEETLISLIAACPNLCRSVRALRRL